MKGDRIKDVGEDDGFKEAPPVADARHYKRGPWKDNNNRSNPSKNSKGLCENGARSLNNLLAMTTQIWNDKWDSRLLIG